MNSDSEKKEHDSSIHPAAGAEVEDDPGSSYLITVQVEDEFEEKVDAAALHRLAIAVLRAEGKQGPFEIGVVVTTDSELHALNRTYLGHDYDTDVISFGMSGEEDFVTPEERPDYLGDIVISYERAAEQGPEYGHTAAQEVATLLIHGILHLLGYDDQDEASRERMHARQDALLAETEFGR